jgi:hypothetical protein
MSIFKNIFHVIDANTRMNFFQLVNVRRAILQRDGISTDNINWEHYAKVLQAKHEILKAS